MGRLARKTFFLIALLCGAQLGVGWLQPDESAPPFYMASALERAAARRAPVVYFGDSVNRKMPEAERELKQAWVSGYLIEALRGADVAEIDHPAFHPQIEASLARLAKRLDYHPRQVVVEINLRCFSPEWDLRPEYQFETETALTDWRDRLPPGLLRPLLVFKALNAPSVNPHDYQRAMDFHEDRTERLVAGLKRKEKKFVRAYLFEVTRDHRKVAALEALADLYRNGPERALFYLTPVDVTSGEALIGPLFRERLAANAKTVQDALTARGAEVLDLHAALPPERFLWRGEGGATEHLDAEGRRFVAERIAERIAWTP